MTPGFEGLMWLKDTFPNKFDFLRTFKTEIVEGDYKLSRGDIVQRNNKGRATVFLNNAPEQAESTEMFFPSLGGEDNADAGLTLEQRMLRDRGFVLKDRGFAITGKKVLFYFNLKSFLEGEEKSE